MSEIVADYRRHLIGEREVVDWDRPDGIHADVPLVYLREATEAEYLARKPHMAGHIPLGTTFWEVSVD